MRLDSARALKAEILAQVTSAEASDLAAGGVWSMNARPTADVDPVARTVALGITRPTRGDYRLAIRVQRRGLENSQQVDSIRRKARGEVDFRYVGHVVKQAVPWEQTRKRPLLIGLSVATTRSGGHPGRVRAPEERRRAARPLQQPRLRRRGPRQEG